MPSRAHSVAASSALPTSSPSSTSRSHHAPDPQSDTILPPPAPPAEEWLEGEGPAILAHRLLHPDHADAASSSSSKRPGAGSRKPSWYERLTGRDSSGSDTAADEEEDVLLVGDEGENGGAAFRSSPSSGSGNGGRRRRRDTSESLHRRRAELPWWKRPSPIFFIPGTICIALAMGMTIAPKLQIYNQLVCSSMDPAVSGVTAPPPIFATDPSHSLSSPSFSSLSLSLPGIGGGEDDGVKVPGPLPGRDAPGAPPRPTSPESDAEWSRQCSHSKAVQKEVANLNLILTLMMGILSSLTTGWWGSFSDRKGRKPVLVIALCGSVLMDLIFVMTVNYHHILDYRFLLLGPLFDGLLGGYTTAQAAATAYLSDCTPSGSRARIFSLLSGLMMAGIAGGPLLSAILVPYGGPLAPFYAALGLHAAYLVAVAAVLPESVDKSLRVAARERHAVEKEKRREKRKARMAAANGLGKKALVYARDVLHDSVAFLKPVALLLPRALPSPSPKRASTTPPTVSSPTAAHEEEGDEEELPAIEWGAHLDEYRHPQDAWEAKEEEEGEEKHRRNWTLTRVAAAWTAYMTIVAVMATKLLYAQYTLGWSAVENGYFLSFIGLSRVFTLVVVLPLFIKRVLGRREAPLPIWPKPEVAENEADEGKKAEGARWEREKKWLKVVHDSHFDHLLALSSLILDLVAFTLYTLSPLLGSRTATSHISFFLLSATFQSLGSGAAPALQSVALAHAPPRDAGRLFASLAVLQSLAAQVVGPLLFSLTWIRTVGTWSEAIFALAAALAAASVLVIARVRLRRVWVVPVGAEGGEGAKPDEGEGETRGRRREVRACESATSLRTQDGREE
ncbi:hypothetical protein JCM8097_007164 [Rhodosporidiobolus ruineniae]